MTVTSRHPSYLEQELDWQISRDTIAGERRVKYDRNLTFYLPVPPGMQEGVTTYFILDRQQLKPGRYRFYASFAEFPDLPGPTLDAFMGLIGQKDPKIELPAQMAYMLERATPSGENLLELWQTVMREVLSAGRVSLLPDVVPGTDEIALVPYKAEALTNWSQTTKREGSQIQLAVLEEHLLELSGEDEFEHKEATVYRELRMRGGVYQVRTWRADGGSAASFTAQVSPGVGGSDASEWVTPTLFGRPFAVDSVPIIVANSYGIGLRYGRIPILPIGKIALAIFRRSADYNRALYIKCDPQVFLSGVQEDDIPETIGGSEIWAFPNPQAKAAYLDIDGNGIPHLRTATMDDYDRYVAAAGRLLEHTARAGQESGVAVGKRLTAQHVTLASVTKEVGSAVLAALQNVAKILGADPKEVVFEPNLDFTQTEMTGQELLEFVTSKNQGAPIALKTIHDVARRRGVTQLTFDEEMALIDAEEPILPAVAEPAPEPEPEPAV